ncbi:MAG: membrane protein insertase YidC [Pseudomonadales bacterium]
METIALLLTPVISLMRVMLEVLNSVVLSYGFSIILLSMVMRLLMMPIAKRAIRAEQRHAQIQLQMAPSLACIRANFEGRQRFERTEALYEKHDYHPIHSITSLGPLLLQLPFLLAALFLLTGYDALDGQSFLFIDDLGAADGLISFQGVVINLLPLLLTAVAIVEAFVKPNTSTNSKLKFIVVATVIAVLIYPLSAAVCLYWLTSNLWSLIVSIKTRSLAE